jgi:Lrp/AsnC family leucine-responsive transcriptional regulator
VEYAGSIGFDRGNNLKSRTEGASRPIDRIDRRILRTLQDDGRISITDLAERVGLSSTPCSERVKRLERDGFITGYHARLSPQALGQSLLVFVEIRLSAKSGQIFEEFKREVLKLPNVLECHLVSGDFDYLIKARIPEMNAYRRLLGDMLLGLPGARESKSYVVMEEIKESLALTVED